MARELRGSEQARRAGLWDEVRPEALVPAERDPVTGSLTRSADSDGGAKDRRTESSGPDTSPPTRSGRHPARAWRRWPVVAAAGAAALVIGVGGAVALANRDADGPGSAAPTPTGTPASTAAGAPPTPPGTAVVGGLDERLYTGTLTSSSEGDVLSSSTAPARIRCEEECRLFSIAISRAVTWPLGETDVSVTLPQEGTIAAWCGDGSFRPEEVWDISFTEDDLSFTRTTTAASVKCPDGVTSSLPSGTFTFSGIRTG